MASDDHTAHVLDQFVVDLELASYPVRHGAQQVVVAGGQLGDQLVTAPGRSGTDLQ